MTTQVLPAPIVPELYEHFYPMVPPHSMRPTKCQQCKTDGLYWSWDRTRDVPILVTTDGRDLPRVHDCDVDIKPGNCRHCKAPDLIWVRKSRTKYELVESYGLQHMCPEWRQYQEDYKEACRVNYKWEKAWLNSFPEDYRCPSCNGSGHILIKSKNKTKSAWRRCKKCRGVGRFNDEHKRIILKQLRKLYWPYRDGVHRWQYGSLK